MKTKTNSSFQTLGLQKKVFFASRFLSSSEQAEPHHESLLNTTHCDVHYKEASQFFIYANMSVLIYSLDVLFLPFLYWFEFLKLI